MAETRNKDYAERETDKTIEELEDRIYRIYKQAYEEARDKFIKKGQDFNEKDKIKRKEFESGKITEEEYINWRKGQSFITERLNQIANELGEDLVHADQIALSVANGYMPDVYAMNFNYQTYDVEQSTQIDTSFTLYSRESVERLEKGGRKILPKRKVDVPKDKKWNVQHLRNEIMQGILQGKSIPDIAKGLRNVTDMDRRASIRNARTMMTGAQNGGRLDAMKRASDLGIRVQKEWMATLDSRTRDSHQRMDGERVGTTRYFSNGLQFPGDPNGRPEEVYNCRCTMVAFYPEYANIISDRITYKEWAEWHNAGTHEEKNANVFEKKEYDFEGKNALYISLKDELKKAQIEFTNAEYNSKYYKTREDEIERLKRNYAEVSNFTEKDISEINKKINKLEEEMIDAEKAYDKWYDRPDRSNIAEYEAWRKWKNEYQEKFGEDAPSYFIRLQSEKNKYISQIAKYDSFKEDLEYAKQLKTKDVILKEFEKAKKEYDRIKKDFENHFNHMDSVLLDAYNKNIVYKKTNVLKNKLSDTEIIQKLAGGDMTKGSCQSLALCYTGNKAGIDVIDFRGGDSQDFFADYRICEMLLDVGMKGEKEKGRNEQKSAVKLLKNMEYNKEYILSGGEHAAVVRRIKGEYGDEEYQYLELQSPYMNGWTTLGYNEESIKANLKWRFAMTQSRTYGGMQHETTVYLLDVDSAKDVENFDTLLGFINTNVDEQKKGKKGIIR